MSDPTRLEDSVEFAENPEPRCACVLLLDTSASMQGAPITALNKGLQTLKDDLMQDTLASRRVEVSVVSFNSDIRVVQDFVTADRFQPPTLAAHGLTHMAAAINRALDMVDARKLAYRANAITYYRPWIFMITDGEPQGEAADEVNRASIRIKDEEAGKRVVFFAVGVENANMSRLAQIAVRTPLKLVGLNFTEMFLWLSSSMKVASQAKPDQHALPPPGWASI